MSDPTTRRDFLQHATAAATALGLAGTASGAAAMKHFVCVTCGMQFAASEKEPDGCPVCLDERQYVGHAGQKWTTLGEYQKTHKNVFAEEEADLHSILPQPKAGIGQRAFLVRTKEGNVLWDCVPPLDDATIQTIKKLGGLAAVAVSHPHYYTTMVEWSHAFGGVPVHTHKNDAKWVLRPDDVVKFWEGETKSLPGGLTLVKTGGHFDGFQVLHWPAGAGGKGVLLSGDQPYVCQDRTWVSFMYSYPNLIPLGPAARGWIRLDIEQIAEILSDAAAASHVPLAAEDVEPAVLALEAAGTVVLAEQDGVTCFRLRRKRKSNAQWKNWALWTWEQLDAAIQRTIATAKNGAALQDAVNDHIAKVNATLIRLNADYERKEREIEEGEFDPASREPRLRRLFENHYGVKRELIRKADRVIITRLMLAAE